MIKILIPSAVALFVFSGFQSQPEPDQEQDQTQDDTQEETADTPPASNEYELTVFYIRHAQSCSNAAANLLLGSQIRDPLLTDCGLYRSLQAGNRFSQYLKDNQISIDFFGASHLLRANETMLMMQYDEFFGHHKVLHQVPYMGESTMGRLAGSLDRIHLSPVGALPENNPEASPIQISRLHEIFPAIASDQIDTSYLGEINKNLVNYRLFRDNILPTIARNLRTQENKQHYYAAIVTHSLTMKDQIGCKRPDGSKAQNNEVYSVTYKFRDQDDRAELTSQDEECVSAVPMKEGLIDTKGPEDTHRCPFAASPEPLPNPLNFPAGNATRETYIESLSTQCKQ